MPNTFPETASQSRPLNFQSRSRHSTPMAVSRVRIKHRSTEAPGALEMNLPPVERYFDHFGQTKSGRSSQSSQRPLLCWRVCAAANSWC
jgi:hypothetical protein